MFEYSKKELLSALTPVSLALGRTIPVYENVLISLDDKVSAIAGNGEMQILSGDSLGNNAILVDGKKILSIVKNAASDKIKFDIKEDHIIVKSGRGRNKVKTLNPDSFPVVQPHNFILEIEISSDQFKGMINAVKNSMADQDVRFYLNGIHIKGGDQLVIEASDGHRLAQIKADIKSEQFECIIPRTAINAIDKVIGNSDVCLIKVYQNKLLVITENESITINLIDGKFPDTGPMLNQDKPHQINVNGKDLKNAINRVMVTCGNELKIDLDLSDKGIGISANNMGEESSDFVEIESSNGVIKNTVLTVSGHYLNNALTDDIVEFNYSKENESINIVSEANHIIMPIKR